MRARDRSSPRSSHGDGRGLAGDSGRSATATQVRVVGLGLALASLGWGCQGGAPGAGPEVGPRSAKSGAEPVRPPPREPTPEEVLVAAERAREGGLGELAALAESGPAGLRGRALRGLGRSGAEGARAPIEAGLGDSGGSRVAAARAYGLLGEVGEVAPLVAALRGADTGTRAAILTALSRVCTADDRARVLPLLSAALEDESLEVAEAAGLALGRLGRRGIELDRAVEAALIVAASRPAAEIRYAATYALARGASPTPAVVDALRGRLADTGSETRGEALVGLGRRWSKAGAAGSGARSGAEGQAPASVDEADEAIAEAVGRALRDPEWPVVLGAIRAATEEAAPAGLRAPVLERLVSAWEGLLGGDGGPEIHLLEAGIERLRPYAGDVEVRAFADRLVRESAAGLDAEGEGAERGGAVLLSRVHCQASALAIRGGASGTTLASCGGPRTRGSALHLRRIVLAEVAGEGLAGGLGTLEELAGSDDARVRLAARVAAGEHAMRAKGPKLRGTAKARAAERGRACALLLAGLGDPSSAVAGGSAGLLGELLAARPMLSGLDRPRILRALVDSLITGAPGDPEFEAALFGATVAALGGGEEGEPGEAAEEAREVRAEGVRAEGVADPAIDVAASLTEAERAGLAERCRGGVTGPAPVRSAAERCLRALGEEPPTAAKEGAAPTSGGGEGEEQVAEPPFEPRSLLGTRVRWTLDTTQGVITIALDPTLAPWNVAALVGLSGQAFYGGVGWHRVVPGFVVQGGDPSGTGWGGPGFSSVGEPSWRPFLRGAVGIADAGPDTGGSQFFIMHARAPHLEGRYTLVGEVVEGMEVVDRLTTDDRVLSTIVDVTPRPGALRRSP